MLKSLLKLNGTEPVFSVIAIVGRVCPLGAVAFTHLTGGPDGWDLRSLSAAAVALIVTLILWTRPIRCTAAQYQRNGMLYALIVAAITVMAFLRITTESVLLLFLFLAMQEHSIRLPDAHTP